MNCSSELLGRTRISIATCNLWDKYFLDRRKQAIVEFVQRVRPDILCVQELCQESFNLLCSCKEYSCVRDDFLGWTTEGNIFWREECFSEIEHGAIDVELHEEERRLFYVKLHTGRESILIATVHLTWAGSDDEVKYGVSPRHKQAQNISHALDTIISNDTLPVILCGDMNDRGGPVYIFRENGYTGCFAAMGISSPPTTNDDMSLQPCVAGAVGASGTVDWIMGNNYVRSLCAQVIKFRHNGVAISDHWPVLAVYELLAGNI